VRSLAPRVRCPTLVLHPLHTDLVPFEEGRLLASLIPGARLVALESRNCLVLADEPAWATWLRETRAFLEQPSGAGTPFEELSPRECDLALLISEGLDNAQIAARLAISEKTVRNHITRIFAKLGVETRAQAIVLAHRVRFGRTVEP
jgi:DNA-binding NarL/FixJ family response regulator